MHSPLKHRWSVAHNYLAGISAGDWWRLLRQNRFAVDGVYWHRAAFITLTSLMNSCYRRVEESRFNAAVARTPIAGPPLFILGHWRSGTTHLHNLIALDTRQFAFANTYQVVNPHTFLCSEALNTRLFSGLLPDKRPMDNMALGFATPQEDEFAYLLATFRSLYLGATFSRRQDHYERYLTFRDVPQEEIDEWKRAFLWFARKLTLKHGRPLVLKSPPHTARIRLLLEMFPDARFVHITESRTRSFSRSSTTSTPRCGTRTCNAPAGTHQRADHLALYVMYTPSLKIAGYSKRTISRCFDELERIRSRSFGCSMTRWGCPDSRRSTKSRDTSHDQNYEKNRFPVCPRRCGAHRRRVGPQLQRMGLSLRPRTAGSLPVRPVIPSSAT